MTTASIPNKPARPIGKVISTFWRNLSLTRKLLAATSVLALNALIIGVFANLGLNSVQDSYEHALSDGVQIEKTSYLLDVNVLEARRREKDFLLRWQTEGVDTAYENYVPLHNKQVVDAQNHILDLLKYSTTIGETFKERLPEEVYIAYLAYASEQLYLYNQNFSDAVRLIQERGFQDTGLEGEFRDAVHNIEDRIYGREGLDPLVITMLQIRRHEKDYLLRGDQTYVDQTNQAVADLKQQITSSDVLESAEKTELITLADEYLVAFDTLVKKDTEISLAIESARTAAHNLEPVTAKISATGAEMGNIDTTNARNSATQALITSLVAVVLAVLAAFFMSTSISRQVTAPIRVLTTSARELEAGNYDVQAEVSSGDEVGALASAFNGMASQLKASVGQIAERAKALEVSSQISRRLTAILDPRQLAGEVVNEVQTAFNYYYAQIYLFDDAGENLVLTAGTGEAGAEMMKRGHRLPKGRGLVGRAAENRESVLVSDTSKDPDWLPNQLLPDTKAEAAIPIAVGDKVLGVLDVQDNITNDINPDDITLLESLASQVAISLQNAESYSRADAALQEAKSLVENAAEGIAVLDLTNGLFTEPNENAAKVYGLSREELVKVGPAQMSPPTQPDGRDSTEKAMEQIGIAMQKGTHIFEWVHINGQGDEFPAEIRLVRLPGDHPRVRVTVIDITERQALQKLTAQRARQQEAINTITQRIQSATTIEEAMQVAARELGHALGNRQTMVALEASALTSDHETAA